MENNLNELLVTLVAGLRSTLQTELTSIWLPIQLGAIALSFLISAGIAALLRRKFDLASTTAGWPAYLRPVAHAVAANYTFIFLIVITELISGILVATAPKPRIYLMDVSTDLAGAWLVIAFLSSMIRNQFVNRLVAVTAWTIAALSILGLLDATTARLDSIGVPIGGLRVTPLLVLKTSALLVVTLWIATAAGNFFDRRLHAVSDLTPSIKELLVKLIRIALMTLAVVVVLASVGIDVAVLAVFTGAVGVGIGFGLQKIISNLVSGIILLADKSIKPGDVISVGEHFGWVGHMGARYTSVDTRDGREYLIPNEDFVTQRVVNWSYSNDLVRVDVKFGATYANDPRKVQNAAIAAALSVPRVLPQPSPICHLDGFAPAAVEFTLWFWIKDPANGVIAVRSAVLLALWDTLEREGIGIPKPGAQRVILEQAKSA